MIKKCMMLMIAVHQQFMVFMYIYISICIILYNKNNKTKTKQQYRLFVSLHFFIQWMIDNNQNFFTI